jgi:hypothetical protein
LSKTSINLTSSIQAVACAWVEHAISDAQELP